MMKNPPHPGKMQMHDLRASGLAAAQVTEILGVMRQKVHGVLTGRSAVFPAMTLRLEPVIGVIADHRFRLQAAGNHFEIRWRAPANSVVLRWFQDVWLWKFVGDSDGQI